MQRYQLVALCLLLMAFVAGTALAQEATEEPITEATEEPTSNDDSGLDITVVPEPIAEVTIEPIPDESARPAEQPTDEEAAQAEETDDTEAMTGTYTVQAGDNLYRIAVRFGTTTAELAALNGITNPRLIFVGQVLQVPGEGEEVPATEPEATEEPTEPPTETEEPTAEAPEEPAEPVGTYTVQPGDNLYRIAIQFNTTVAELRALNNIANSNVIFTGQTLQVPGGDTAEPAPDDEGEATEPEEPTPSATMTDPGFDFGVIAYTSGQDATTLAGQVDMLNVNWVKVYADWSDIESTQGTYDFSELDGVVSALSGNNVMVTVINAPEWSRSVTGDIIENGPPDDLSNFESFMTAIATEFTGQVTAYQIWEEPNLRRNWRCDSNDRPAMCDVDYLEMLSIADTAVAGADADAMIVSAGLAPTRFNDRVNAIDDRLFLETLVVNGLMDSADAVGVHPGGFANPPDAECCEQSSGVETHFEDASFYFLENLQNYRSILTNNGAGDLPIWVTRFGWGTSEDTDPPGEINIYVTYTSLGQQAIYAPRAFEIGEELGFVGVMFLDNLNGCTVNSSRAEVCYTSLLAPDGSERPIFQAVSTINGDLQGADEPATEATDDTTEESMTDDEMAEEAPVEAIPQAEVTEEAGN